VIAVGGLRGATVLNEVVAWDGASWATLPSGPSGPLRVGDDLDDQRRSPSSSAG
jgi:hypothetical protein